MAALPDRARLHLTYFPESGPVLIGNRDGLRYLSDLCAVLAAAPEPSASTPAEHTHLNVGKPPLFGSSYSLTLYHAVQRLVRHACRPPGGYQIGRTGGRGRTATARVGCVRSIAATELYGDQPLPPTLLLRYDKLYRVLEQRPYKDDKDCPTDGTDRVSWNHANITRDSRSAPRNPG